MLENRVKQALQRNQAVLGTGVAPPVGIAMLRYLASTKLDWLFVDTEHSGGDMHDVFNDVQAADLMGLTPVLRVPDTQYHLIARAMDMGALSIMVPRVESKEQAERAVSYMKYPPMGRRGMGSAFYLGFASLPPAEGLPISNEQSMLVVQIESLTGVKNAEAIASVPGVDVLFIGPLDLSISLGKPGDFTTAEWMEQAVQVLAAAKKQHKAAGIVCTAAEIGDWYAKGMRMFSVGSTMSHMAAALRSVRAEFTRQTGQ
jgi:2-keto-3-deoxy-L-rhamnonate aldolase RhmA